MSESVSQSFTWSISERAGERLRGKLNGVGEVGRKGRRESERVSAMRK